MAKTKGRAKTAPRARSTERPATGGAHGALWRQLALLGGIVVSVYVLVAVATYNPRDPSFTHFSADAVHNAGGLTAVQRPDTAQAPQMVVSALTRTPAQFVLSVAEIAGLLGTLGA